MRLLIILLTVVVMTVTGCGSSDVNESSTAGNSVEVTTGSSQETQGATDKETGAESQAQTVAESQKASQAPTQKATQSQTQTVTQKATQAPTQEVTQAQTQAPTQATTQAQAQTTNVGDKISLGTYNGKPIEWTVLAKENGKTLIITAEAIDRKPYNNEMVNVTWETCTLRNWLNNDFYNAAFSTSEKARIADTNVVAEKNPRYDTAPGSNTVDKVFLLSINEVNKYFPNDTARKCTYYGNRSWWWLRSPGNYGKLAANVASDGSVYYFGYNVSYDNGAVRPALWINQ